MKLIIENWNNSLSKNYTQYYNIDGMKFYHKKQYRDNNVFYSSYYVIHNVLYGYYIYNRNNINLKLFL